MESQSRRHRDRSTTPSATAIQASKRYASRVAKYKKLFKKLEKKNSVIEKKIEKKLQQSTDRRAESIKLDVIASKLRVENDVLRDEGRAQTQATAQAEQLLRDVATENASLEQHLYELRERCRNLEKTIDAQHSEIKLKAKTSMLIQQGRHKAQEARLVASARQQVVQGETPSISPPKDLGFVVKKGQEYVVDTVER